jgi:ABC-2 type transport system permease protein
VLFGWKREEIILLNGVYAVVIGLFHSIFSKNFEQLTHLIEHGELDSILIKPADSQFQVSFQLFSYTALVRVMLGLLFILYFSISLHIPFSMVYMVGFLGLMVISLILLYSIWLFILTFLIWNPQLSNLVVILFSFSSMAKYPYDMYKRTGEILAGVIFPLTLITVVPVHVLYQKILWRELGIFFLCAILFFTIARKFWFFALRYYVSGSS